MYTARPLVTVGVPTYNGARFLRQALTSILQQTYGDFELVISDNASTDGTADICQEFVSQDPRITYLRNQVTRGANHNFNRLLKAARGKYFMWAGDHDLWHATWLASCLEILETDRNAALAYSHTMLIDADGKPVGDMGDRIDTRGMSATQRYQYVLYNLTWGNMVYAVVRTKLLREAGGYAPCHKYWWADQLLLGTLALRGTFAQIAAPLFLRRKTRPDETPAEQIKRQDEMTRDPAAEVTRALPLEAQKRRLRNRNLWEIARAPLTTSEKLVAAHTVIDYFETFHGVRAPLLSSLRCMAVALFSKQRLKRLLLTNR
jgi:glycosyltransferase involved in cell wall biosynthesis